MLMPAQLSPEAAEVIFWLVVIVVAAGLLVAVALLVRRRMMSGEEGTVEPFTLADLRRLHGEGQLTDEEFERAKAAMIAKTRQRLRDDPPHDAQGGGAEGS